MSTTYEVLLNACNADDLASVEDLYQQCLERFDADLDVYQQSIDQISFIKKEIADLEFDLHELERNLPQLEQSVLQAKNAIARYRIWAGIEPCPGQLKLLEV